MKIQKKSLLTALCLGVFATAPLFAQDVQSALRDLESERFAKAEQSFKQLASSSPSADNQFYLGYYYLKANQPDQAKAAFEKGLQADPKNHLNNVGLAGVALAKNDLATAQAKIDEAVKATKGKNMDVLLRAGEMYTMFEKNDPARALSLLDMAAKLDKKNTNNDIKMIMGDAYMIKNDGGNAVSRYEDVLMAKPNTAEANYKIGKVYLRGKNYKLAQDFYKKAIDSDPEFAPTYRDLAEAFFGSRVYKSAASNMDLYLQKSQNTDPEMILRSAQFDFLAQDYQKAISKLDQLKGKVNNPVIDRMYGWAYSALGKNDQAIETLNRFISTAPEKVIYDDYKYLGRAYGQAGTPEGDSLSIVYLEKAAPEDTTENLYREIGQKFYGDKRYDRAVTYFEKTIANDKEPKNNDYYYLGLSSFLQAFRSANELKSDTAAARQARTTYLQKSDQAFDKVIQNTPEFATAHFYKGQINYFMNSPSEALANGAPAPHYEKFIELANNEIAADANKKAQYQRNLITAYKFLGGYHMAKKDEAKGKEYLSKVLELDPNDKDAKQALEGPKAAPAPAAKPKAPAKKTT
ncbi:tetratricopeptide repeat protein [Nibrella saemangeumensis]